MSSNYPPGVTGHEPQIAGDEEIVERRDCDEEVPWVRADPIRSRAIGLIAAARREPLTSALMTGLQALDQALDDDHVRLAPCDWSGEVTIRVDRGGTGYWICRGCGIEHTEDLTGA